MHVSLTNRLDEYVREKVSSGLYNNASEVIREALRQKISADETNEVRLQKLHDAIDPAITQADQDELLTYDMTSIQAELDQEMTPNA